MVKSTEIGTIVTFDAVIKPRSTFENLARDFVAMFRTLSLKLKESILGTQQDTLTLPFLDSSWSGVILNNPSSHALKDYISNYCIAG